MSKFFLSFIACMIFLYSGCKQNHLEHDVVLWYETPAKEWYEALPIGNGTLGAMVYGGIETEHLQLNENTLYSGEPNQRDVKIDVTENLDMVRGLIEKGDLEQVNRIIGEQWIGRAQPCYQPFGDLFIEFDHSGAISNYKRALDISTATGQTSYTIDNTHYKREIFASFPDQVIVLKLNSSNSSGISCKIRLEGAHPTSSSKTEGNVIIMKGQAPALAVRRSIAKIKNWNDEWKYPELFDENGDQIPGTETIMYGDKLQGKGTFYEGRVGVELKGGTLKVEGSKLLVSNAHEVKIVLSGDTSYNGFDKSPSKEGVDPSIVSSAALEKALVKNYSSLKEDHLMDYMELFGRVSFTLGKISEQGRLPTQKRLELFKNGKDPSLCALFMQHARYLTIASSRPGGQPINLQGMWNNKIIPSWASAYTMNINVEMNYWITEAANLSECNEPFFRFIKELSVNGAKHAKESFGLPGWVAHHNTSLWRSAQPVDNANNAFWPMAGGWLCQHIWTHYMYSKDIDFLKNNWPVLIGAAEFFNEWLVSTNDGYYTTPVGTSPEHRYYPEGEPYLTSFSQGPTMDIMIIKELFTNCIQASEVLGVNNKLIEDVRLKVSRLQDYRMGKNGQLLEWDKEYKEADPLHRHISHLYALAPGNEITKNTMPDLLNAAKRVLQIKGDAGTGWSMAWKALCWARLKDGNHAYNIVNNLFVPAMDYKTGILPALLVAHPVYNIDGNFGTASCLIEMMMQSHETGFVQNEEVPIIELLPALPDAWKDGEVKGLKAIHGFEVEMKWNDSALVKAKITSLLGEKAILRFHGKDILLNLKKGETYTYTL